VVHLSSAPSPDENDGPGTPSDPPYTIDLSRSTVDYCYPGVARYTVDQGKTIRVIADSHADLSVVARLTRNLALVVALHQRGRVLLHGSCFVVNGRAVSVVGASRSGKSTLLASMMLRGAALVSDGLTALEPRDSGYWALPGPPDLKLWPDALERLGESPERFPLLDPAWDKRIMPAPGRVMESPAPLGQVLVLTDGEEERIEPMSPSTTAFELVRNAFLVEYASASSQPILLAQMAKLAARVSVARLRRRRGADHLESLLDVIERELETSHRGSDERSAR
jgi:hypothetical protein